MSQAGGRQGGGSWTDLLSHSRPQREFQGEGSQFGQPRSGLGSFITEARRPPSHTEPQGGHSLRARLRPRPQGPTLVFKDQPVTRGGGRAPQPRVSPLPEGGGVSLGGALGGGDRVEHTSGEEPGAFPHFLVFMVVQK